MTDQQATPPAATGHRCYSCGSQVPSELLPPVLAAGRVNAHRLARHARRRLRANQWGARIFSAGQPHPRQ